MNIVWSGVDSPALNDALGNWCAQHIGLPRGFRDHACMAVFDDREPVAVCVFHDWQPERGVVEMSAAAETPRWLTRTILLEMFTYVFKQLGCQNVVMRVSEQNKRLARILTAYGFEHVTIPRLRGRDENERVYWLTDDAWAANGFHEVKNGQVVS